MFGFATINVTTMQSAAMWIIRLIHRILIQRRLSMPILFNWVFVLISCLPNDKPQGRGASPHPDGVACSVSSSSCVSFSDIMWLISNPDLSVVISLVQFVTKFFCLHFIAAWNYHLIFAGFVVNHDEITGPSGFNCECAGNLWKVVFGHSCSRCSFLPNDKPQGRGALAASRWRRMFGSFTSSG